MTSDRESKAIDTFIKIFKGSYQKVNATYSYYKIYNDKKDLISYACVVPRYKVIPNAYPLIVDVNTISNVISKRLNPVIIWACDDGIIYGKVKDIYGEIKWGSFLPHDSNGELICYYSKQKQFKYIRFL